MKCDKKLLYSALGFTLQNMTVVLQDVTATTKCNESITKCNSYYKI